ncbi:hypothetical protein [Candidatus Protofrankia californiensis]|uniref:hypothetical protein n=1 Tax=Candidatus Protofrankia californiensis TaxID=1839754 RepID=UPI0010417CB2|nr:hypothetical protein [Candidatus Protofrankia californiensis]
MSSARPRRTRLLGAVLMLGTVVGVAVAAASVSSSATPEGSTAAKPSGSPVCLVEADGVEHNVKVLSTVTTELYHKTRSYPGPCAVYGEPVVLGDGRIRTYAQLDGVRPFSLGFVFGKNALTNLPTANTDGQHCYDVDGDGTIDEQAECVHSHDFVLELPQQFTEQVGGPFTWALLTWDPHGHAPDPVYGLPHFDFHFYIQDLAARNAIRTGSGSGEGLINGDDYATARVPVSDRYRPDGYFDFGAVVSAMGNHLTDLSSPEFNGNMFTHTFMYGAYNGEITFYEPMITKAWLAEVTGGKADSCTPIKAPAAWKVAGWYPTRYCIEYRKNREELTVSLTDFAYRPAS